MFGLAVLACGGKTQWPGDPELFGKAVVDESAAHVTQSPDFRTNYRAAVTKSLGYMGMGEAEVEGIRVVFTDHVECGGVESAGCWRPDDNTILIDVQQADCLESGVLSHELLHVFLDGDPEHTNWRWSPEWWDPLYDALLDGSSWCQHGF